VADGVNGTLVQPGDVAGLAQALLGYVEGQGASTRIAEQGKNAWQLAEQRFSIPVMAEAYATVYDQTLGRHQAAIKLDINRD